MKKRNKIFKAISVALTVIILIPALASCSSCSKKQDMSFTIPERSITSNETLEYGYYTYQLYDDGTAIITDYNGSESNLSIPDAINGHTVVEIAGGVFMPSLSEAETNSGPARLSSVTLNPSLEKIGEYAFYQCTKLSSITFGEKLWSVGYDAFADTPWIKAQSDDFVIVGNGILIKYQGKDTAITIPDGVRHISAAFSNNQDIRTVSMGDSVLTVGVSAFSGCQELISVKFGNNVKYIDDYAFSFCFTLKSLDLPDSLEQIGVSSFYCCYALNSVKCGASLKKLSESTFDSCSNIKTIDIPSTLTVIEEKAFYNCLNLSIVFYDGTEEQFNAITFIGDGGSNFLFKDAIKIYGENDEKQ